PSVRTRRLDGIRACGRADSTGSRRTVRTSLRTLTEIWRGDRSWPQALSNDLVAVAGPSAAVKGVPRWLGQMSSAAIPRPA
ncbi:MAG: hypothetical protein H0V42_08095, partial [Nocardioidaceae bacterium]|nr:hypothetical protein [Nocardioidaceae bacterium]